MFRGSQRIHRGKGLHTRCASLRLLVLILPGQGSTLFSMKGSSRTGTIQPSRFVAGTNTDGRAHRLLVQHTVSRFCGSSLATVGQAASAGLEEEVTALVGAVAGEDSETFSSRGGKSTSIAPIVGRVSRPSIMF